MYPVISTLARNDSALSIKQFVYTILLVIIVLGLSLKSKKNEGAYENRR